MSMPLVEAFIEVESVMSDPTCFPSLKNLTVLPVLITAIWYQVFVSKESVIWLDTTPRTTDHCPAVDAHPSLKKFDPVSSEWAIKT